MVDNMELGYAEQSQGIAPNVPADATAGSRYNRGSLSNCPKVGGKPQPKKLRKYATHQMAETVGICED